jgi:hypothetical protein
MVYNSIDPIGRDRDDARQALTSCLIANVNRPKNRAPYDIKDFMIVAGPRTQQTMEQMKQTLKKTIKEK